MPPKEFQKAIPYQFLSGKINRYPAYLECRDNLDSTYSHENKSFKGQCSALHFQLISMRIRVTFSSVQLLSRVQLCDPMNRSTPGLPVHHQLPEFTQTHVHRVSDAIQPFHPLSSLSPPALNLSQHQGLFEWVSSSHEVVKVLEFQLQHQSFQWTPRTDLL